MEKDSGTALHVLTVDGGMSNSDVCMQVKKKKILSKTPLSFLFFWLINHC